MTMDFFSISDKKGKDILYVQMASFKASKELNNTINYHLLIDDLTDLYQLYFKDLEDEHFHIIFHNANDYKDRIKLTSRSYLYFLRCLAPSIFPQLDKILYLDTDLACVNVGIELFWNTDLTYKFAAGVVDILIQYNNPYLMVNVGKNEYFNAGVLLMNLKKIRLLGIDKKLELYLIKWPKNLRCILYDQTLLNYVFGDQVKYVSTKWNNSILAMVERDESAYKNYYCTDDLIYKVKDAVILHLKGPKPWNPVSPATEDMLPYRKMAQRIYGLIYKQFGKHEEF